MDWINKIILYGWIICSLIHIPLTMFDIAEVYREDKSTLFQELMFLLLAINELFFVAVILVFIPLNNL